MKPVGFAGNLLILLKHWYMPVDCITLKPC
jgi:hypothetical protein